MARKTSKKEVITEGSENVFRDLGFKDADERLVKAELVLAISLAMRDLGLTQTKLARLINMDQPAVSKLLRGLTDGYSVERLIKILNKLGQDVDIAVRPKRERAKYGKVRVALPHQTETRRDVLIVKESGPRAKSAKKGSKPTARN